jgi:hypothetical protein
MARIDEVLAGEESWAAWWVDVAGHAGLGAAYSLPFEFLALWLGWGSGWAFGLGELVALFGGAARELYQGLKSRKWHLLDRTLDVAGHALGPLISFPLAYLVLRLVR